VVSLFIVVENRLQMKELQLLDLTKQLTDINARLKQFASMYEVVKNERNTYANSIQAASQTIAEMRERIKILHNEVDILQNESVAKDKALAKERQSHAIAAAQRDST
jgi:archaellum component FlaC